jgi:hypothetical protein
MSDAVKAALREAHREASSFYTEADTARIVAAFHERLEAQHPGKLWTAADLAAAVTRAAQEDKR